ncbi:hypothetical protein LDENG_00150110 [Lucifuga dentata]|nr:hypothetical protein LDENG_00150110 [Lucifuga dentata]
MTEEFDEDVVFENSPLFQYLHDLGHTDFEACPTASQEEECGGGDGDPTSPEELRRKSSAACLWSLADAVWRWSPFQQAAASRKLEQQLDCVFGQYSVRCILDQDVLLQEDVELIELLDPSLLTLSSAPSGSHSRASTLPRPSLIASPSLWDMAGLMGLAAVLLGLCSISGGLWSLAAAPWGFALLGCVGLRGVTLWKQGCLQRAVHSRATQLQTLVHNSKMLTGLSRKALRLVQETEVISRGFTLLLDRVSAAGSFSRAGPGAGPRGQQLMGLRKAVYRALRSAFRASLPLKELGLGLGIEHLGDEQAQELTDDYSLPALKMLFQLWVAQSSECFRRLALLLSPRRLEEPAEGAVRDEAPPLCPSITAVTEPLHHALTSCLTEVQRSYDFHRYFETQQRTTGSDRTGRAREKCRELNSLHTSIRSLQLHLKALLSEMIILEDDLEKLMVSEEPVDLTFEGYQDLSDRLHQLQPHMQASAGCWDDTIAQVEHMLRRANACPGNAESEEQCAPPPPQTAPPPSYPLILDQDPVPEELELEAYVSDSDSDSEGRGSWSDVLSSEERERQRRDREESRRVLSELKAVLGFRASESERMKRKQLLFNDQAAPAPSTSRENSEACADGKSSDPPVSAGSIETGEKEENYISECTTGNDAEKEEGKEERMSPDLSAEPVTEFSCGLEAEEKEEGGTSLLVCTGGRGGGGGGSELYQYDGVPEEERDDQNGLDFLLKHRVPVLTVMDRLTEIHGSEALSFSSALAAQVVARSHSLINMEEQTFGDEEDEEDEEESGRQA